MKRAANKELSRSTVAWECKCDCGKNVVVTGKSLKSGGVKSCGCLRGENHNMRYSRLYSIYTNMKTRCTNKNTQSFLDYGARGIKICKEWQDSFTNFMEWAMNNGYNEKLTIDRIDVNGNYEPRNCRWVNIIEQANNKRTSVYYEFNGQIHTIAEWSKILPISRKNVYQRIERGKSVDDLFQKANEKAIRCIERAIELRCNNGKR